MTCDDYQIAFDQRIAGVVPVIPGVEVDAHVARCAACTAYVSLSRKMSSAMSIVLAAAPAPLNLEAIRERMAREARMIAIRLPVMFALAAVATCIGVAVASSRLAPVSTVVMGVSVTAVSCLLAYLAVAAVIKPRLAVRQSEISALAQARGVELVAGLRLQLERKIRQLGTLGWGVGILVAINALSVAVSLGDWMQHGPWSVLAHTAFVPLMAAMGSMLVVQRRRLRRERAQLGS